MTYLLTQMALYMLCALILGFILGWLIWGRLGAQLRNCQADRAKLSAELKSRGDNSAELARIATLEGELEQSRSAQVRFEQDARIAREEAAESASFAASASKAATAASAVGAVSASAASKANALSFRPDCRLVFL